MYISIFNWRLLVLSRQDTYIRICPSSFITATSTSRPHPPLPPYTCTTTMHVHTLSMHSATSQAYNNAYQGDIMGM